MAGATLAQWKGKGTKKQNSSLRISLLKLPFNLIQPLAVSSSIYHAAILVLLDNVLRSLLQSFANLLHISVCAWL